MGTPIYILDPGFITGEGHHRGADGMLGVAALARDCEAIIVADANSPLDHIEHEGHEIRVLPLLGQSPYLGAVRRSLDELLALNASAEAEFTKLEPRLEPAARILVHTTNETQVLGLARWVTQHAGKKFESAVVALMLPPPVRVAEDGTLTEDDPAACEIYRRAIHLMNRHPAVTVYGIGATIAEDHARCAGDGAQVAVGGALVGGLGRPLPAREPGQPPKVLLFMGDAKLDKGFHLLPEMVRLLRASPIQARFVLHVSGSMTQRYAWVVEQLRLVTEGDERFTLLEGRLSEEQYDAVFSDADLTTLTYHPGVYGRKTSGVCWDSINNGLPAVVVDRTWHRLEFERYGHPLVVAESFSPEAVVAALAQAIPRIPELMQAAQVSRKRFARLNTPGFYVDAVLGRDPLVAGAEEEPEPTQPPVQADAPALADADAPAAADSVATLAEPASAAADEPDPALDRGEVDEVTAAVLAALAALGDGTAAALPQTPAAAPKDD